jgi:uncharacterized damage-inducible protein DinB
MNGALLQDAFGHHVWATIRVIDACSTLDPAQLEAGSPGTYGSILETLRHTVGADSSYLFVLTGGEVPEIQEASMGLAELRAEMERNGPRWKAYLERDLDPAVMVIRHRDDGTEGGAPLAVRVAQAIHHGTDHRSQICTVLTNLGIEPPAIDVWDYADSQGRLTDTAEPD